MSALHISFSAETVFHVGSFPVSNSLLTSSIVSLLLIFLAALGRSTLKTTGKPSRFQAFLEFIIESLNNLVISVAGTGKRARLFAPIVMTFFLFILVNNWFGLLPGVGTIGFVEKETKQETQSSELSSYFFLKPVNASETTAAGEIVPEETAGTNKAQEQEEVKTAESAHGTQQKEGTFVPYLRAGTADLNTTIALALISMGLVQYFGFKFQHLHYLKKFFNFGNPINAYVGLLELVSEIAKIISFAFRLFGNIFAGEVLLAVIGFLVPVILPMPFYGLELFVGFIQALVFSMLSLVFFNMATIGHDEEHA